MSACFLLSSQPFNHSRFIAFHFFFFNFLGSNIYCIFIKYWKKQVWTKSADPDQTSQNTAFDQDCFLLDNIYIRFGTKLFRQIVGMPMGTNCAPLVAELFLFCYERDFVMSLSVENQSEIIEAFISTTIFGWFIEYWQYLFRRFNQSNLPPELQLNKAKSSVFGFTFIYCKWVCFLQNLW